MLAPGVLGLVPLGFCIALIALITVELGWAQHHDGEVLRSLRGVFASWLFLLAFPFIAGVASAHHEAPFDSRVVVFLDGWIWVARCTLATALVRFWLNLHRWARTKRDKGAS